MESGEATELLGDLASQQWGLFTSSQAGGLEIASPDLLRLEKVGVLERIRHGVYAIAGTALSAEIELKAQWLAIRPDIMAAERLRDNSLAGEAVVSHTTAADLWGIGDLWSDGYHFTVQKRRRSRQPEVHFHRADLAETDWKIHPEAGLPVTSPARTIADLADAGYEADHLLDMVSDTGKKQLVDLDSLFEALYGREASFGLEAGDRAGLRQLLADHLGPEEIDPRVAAAIERSLEPVRESFREIAEVLRSDTLMSKELKTAMQNASEAINRSFPKGVLKHQDFSGAISGRLLDPVLANDPSLRGGVWDPDASVWKRED